MFLTAQINFYLCCMQPPNHRHRRHWRKGGAGSLCGQGPQEMHVTPAGRLVTFGLKHLGYNVVGVPCPCSLCITLEPVCQVFHYCTVCTGRVMGYYIDHAHSVLCTPRGCTVHTTHGFVQTSHYHHPAVVTCQCHLGPS